MIDRYSLLEKNPKVSEKIYGLNFDILKDTLKKVQLLYYQKLEENPISKRGLNAEFTFEIATANRPIFIDNGIP
jgi:hypothetical protein